MNKIIKESNKKKTSKQKSDYDAPSYYFSEESAYSDPNHRYCDGDCGGCPKFYLCNK